MDADQRRSVAAKIVEARRRLGWSQARLAAEAGVSENTVLSAEQGTRATQEGKLRAILEALNLVPEVGVLSLDGIPEDVQMFLRVAAPRLAALSEGRRARLLAELYPRLLVNHEPNGE